MSQASGPGKASCNSASSTSALNGTEAAFARDAGNSQSDGSGTAGDSEDSGALSEGTGQDCQEGASTRSNTPRPEDPPGPTAEGQGMSAGTYNCDSDNSTLAGTGIDGRGYSTDYCTTVVDSDSSLTDIPDSDGEGQPGSAYADVSDGDMSTNGDMGGDDGGQTPGSDTSGVDSEESDDGDSDDTTRASTSCHFHDDSSDADISNDSDESTDPDPDDEQ